MVKSEVSDVIQIITTDLELKHILKGGLSSYYIPGSEKTEQGHLCYPWYFVLWDTSVCSQAPASSFQERGKKNWS